MLERSPRGVELTAAGASLRPHAKALLLEINEMQADMRDHADGRKGTLRVLANTSAMTERLPADLAAFSRLNPDVRLGVQERWSSEIVRSLQAGEADIGRPRPGHPAVRRRQPAGPGAGAAVRPLMEPWAERNMLVCVKKERAANPSVAKLVEHLVAARGN